MTYLIVDVETTTSNQGNPFDQSNKLVYVGTSKGLYPFEYQDLPYKGSIDEVTKQLEEAKTLVGFNIKFDLHWLRRSGFDISDKEVWDCQLAHFILNGQQDILPSLDQVAASWGLEQKLNIVKEEYWDKGIDTTEIPKEILEEYLQQDINLTHQVYLKQKEALKDKPIELQRLIQLHNLDLLVLEEIEYNGLLFNTNKSEELTNETLEELSELDGNLMGIHNCSAFNPNSTDHLSAFLYGGVIRLSHKVPAGFFKSGAKAGQVKEKWEEYKVVMPQRFKPLKGSELKKEGYYSTDEATLKALKGSEESLKVLELLLKRSTLEKRVSTYYKGIPELIKQLNWKENQIHGQLNQTIARTGRLTSSRPNLQNFDSEIKPLFLSRF